MRIWIAAGVGLLLAPGCTRHDAAPPADAPRPAPQRFAPLARVPVDAGAQEAPYAVAPFAPQGAPLPAGAQRVELDGDRATSSGAPFDAAKLPAGAAVLLVPVGDTYLAQVAALLARLDDAHARVWLAHPDAPLAYPVVLRDEPAFQRWLDEPVPGKLRVVQRADGFELQTNMGKLPGPDPNGPSVPVRGGRFDLATLRKGLEEIKGRFPEAPDVCFLPSYGTAVADVVRALAADATAPDASIFPTECLVYPRPRAAPDAGR